jgi:predicted aspartyl protease
MRDGQKAMREGQYPTALKIYTELLSESKESVQAHLAIAFAYLKMLNYQQCFDHAKLVMKLDPENARAYALAGAALLRSGYVAAASQQIVQAFKLDQKEALAYGAAAEIDYYEGRTKDSREKAFQAHWLDPNEADYLVTIARAASRLELFGEAADAYDRFLKVAPLTDVDRREKIEGLIRYYRKLDGIRVYQVAGEEQAEANFSLGRDRRPYLTLQINGRPARFVIDTGSYSTVVSEKAAKRLGISEVARGGRSEGFGGNGKFPIIYGLIKTVQIGEAKVQSVPCFIRPFHAPEDHPEEEKEDGLIGLAVLSSFLTELDYGAGKLKIDRSSDVVAPLQLPPDVRVIPFRTTQNGLISVETEIDGGNKINAILDSAAGSLVVSSAAVKRFNLAEQKIKGQTIRVIGAAGVADNVELLFVKNCRVADLQQENLRALILDFSVINETSGFEQSGILGGDFLRNYKVTIDFARAQIRLQPHSPESPRGEQMNKATDGVWRQKTAFWD